VISSLWSRCIAMSATILVASSIVGPDFAQAKGGGTTIADATLVATDMTQWGDTRSPDMVVNKNSPLAAGCPAGSSGSLHEQVWKVDLVRGDRVTVTGTYNAPARGMEIAFWPAGTTDADLAAGRIPHRNFSGNNIAGYAGGDLGLYRSITFTVPSSGTYPFVVGSCDGSAGPYNFDITVFRSGPHGHDHRRGR